MKGYLHPRLWKRTLFIIATLFIAGYVLAVYTMIVKVSENERRQVKVWANTVQKKADMVNYTEQFFKKVREEEQQRAKLLASAFSYLGRSEFGDEGNTIYFDIVLSNKSTPVILVDSENNILSARNVDFNIDTIEKFTEPIKKSFSLYPPIEIHPVRHIVQYLYYADSKLYSELYRVLEEMNQSFFDETADNIAAVPVIITDSTQNIIYAMGNIPPNKTNMSDSLYIVHTLRKMKAHNAPIIVTLPAQGVRYIYYMDSEILVLMRWFPFIHFFFLLLLIFLAYTVFSIGRNAEQNRVWAGMAKETAHQLGTPISSMIAWVELLKLQDSNSEIATELEKDILRLHVIADRFSKIGSAPVADYQNLIPIIQDTLNYLKKRISSQITINFLHPLYPVCTFVNAQLFSWVVENLTRNAVDAMGGNSGTFTVELKEKNEYIIIDFTDTGKGIPKNIQRKIFSPGFTTKQRGWGLGLTLVKRILNDRKGKIFIKNSTAGEGTTLRIILKKSAD